MKRRKDNSTGKDGPKKPIKTRGSITIQGRAWEKEEIAREEGRRLATGGEVIIIPPALPKVPKLVMKRRLEGDKRRRPVPGSLAWFFTHVPETYETLRVVAGKSPEVRKFWEGLSETIDNHMAKTYEEICDHVGVQPHEVMAAVSTHLAAFGVAAAKTIIAMELPKIAQVAAEQAQSHEGGFADRQLLLKGSGVSEEKGVGGVEVNVNTGITLNQLNLPNMADLLRGGNKILGRQKKAPGEVIPFPARLSEGNSESVIEAEVVKEEKEPVDVG